MSIRIDPDSVVPIYLQIVDAIKHQIVTGQLKPGQQLPTVRELAAGLRINPNTVARAYDQLDGDHVISTQQGRGTFVRERPDQAHLARLHQERLNTLAHSMIGKALSMGYTPQEVRAAFEAQWEAWTKTRPGGKAAG